MGGIGPVDPRRVVGVTADGSGYSAIVIDAAGKERDDCKHGDQLEPLAVIVWYSCTAEAWLCTECERVVYRTTWTSPGWVSTKARITGELTLKTIALAQERLTLRRWAEP